MGKNPTVDFYFTKEKKWRKEIEELRNITLSCRLSEVLKWGVPVYTIDSSDGQGTVNIVLIHVFKDYCALLFNKGVLLKDTKKMLIQQTKNVQSGRQLRFTSSSEILKSKALIKSYIFEAIEIEKAGLKVEFKKTEEYDIPTEFGTELSKNKTLKKAFSLLTPGRQRGYLLYFSAAKQAKTRIARVEKYIPIILQGKGLEDK